MRIDVIVVNHVDFRHLSGRSDATRLEYVTGFTESISDFRCRRLFDAFPRCLIFIIRA